MRTGTLSVISLRLDSSCTGVPSSVSQPHCQPFDEPVGNLSFRRKWTRIQPNVRRKSVQASAPASWNVVTFLNQEGVRAQVPPVLRTISTFVITAHCPHSMVWSADCSDSVDVDSSWPPNSKACVLATRSRATIRYIRTVLRCNCCASTVPSSTLMNWASIRNSASTTIKRPVITTLAPINRPIFTVE